VCVCVCECLKQNNATICTMYIIMCPMVVFPVLHRIYRERRFLQKLERGNSISNLGKKVEYGGGVVALRRKKSISIVTVTNLSREYM